MKKEKQRGLIMQLYLIALAAIVIIGVFTQLTQQGIQKNRFRKQACVWASQAAGEVISSLKEYPAYEWLLDYWIAHDDELEIEYDAGFAGGTLTEKKCALLTKRHPDLQLRYCTAEELEALPGEDRRLYAEIVYAWMINRMDEIKLSLSCDFLSIVLTDTDEGARPYETQYFLMSAADPSVSRGTDYGQAYTLGVTVSLQESDSSRETMKKAVELARDPGNKDLEERTAGEELKNAGNYLDHYTFMETSEGGTRAYLVGSTYKKEDVLGQIQLSVTKDTLIAMLYQFLLLNLIVADILLVFLGPLKKVAQSIRSYTETKDSKAVGEEMEGILSDKAALGIRRNEIGQLAEDFKALTEEIDSYTTQIRQSAAEKERIAFELETAGQIQLQMLPDGAPHFPDHPEFELCASMTPAKMVGGDFYDYFFTDEHHLALVMADVSDKGIPASLFMAESKALIKSQARTGLEPAQILTHVNEQLSENNNGKCFVTVWLAIIDLRTGDGTATNAGHEHPALCRKGEPYELVIYKHGMVVGMMEGVSYRQHTFKLNPGDSLYVYTDGVPEASNEELEQFGTERMLDALNRSKDKTAEEQVAAVSGEINAFMGRAARFDDTTMMCFRYHGMAPGPEDHDPVRPV